MSRSLQACIRLLGERGDRVYGGEVVTQLQHALQAATLAQCAGEPGSLIVAALFHDLGHLLSADARPGGGGDCHDALGADVLDPLFGAAVSGPVGLHVAAKRFLITVDASYGDRLSEASLRSLRVQGGEMAMDESARFLESPHSAAALRLRRYDDDAKDPTMQTPDLEHFLAIAHQVHRHPDCA